MPEKSNTEAWLADMTPVREAAYNMILRQIAEMRDFALVAFGYEEGAGVLISALVATGNENDLDGLHLWVEATSDSDPRDLIAKAHSRPIYLREKG